MTAEQFEALEEVKSCALELSKAVYRLESSLQADISETEHNFLVQLSELPTDKQEYILGLLYGMWLESKKDG